MTPDLARAFVERGWVVIDLEEADAVAEIGDALLAQLQATAMPDLPRLEDYHHYADDAAHETVRFDLARWYWDTRLGHRIVEANLAFLQGFVGLDLHVQRFPYLRVVRPGKPEDVTGIHRDTDYGASPYEVSMVVPFTALDADAALRVVSGSHLEPADRYPATRAESDAVTPGSPRHLLGFPYAPQVLDPDVVERAEPVEVGVGQALVMSLGLVHGQVVNASTSTRVTTDIRVVNSLAPVTFARGVRADYYERLCESPVTEQARHHGEGSDSDPGSLSAD